MKIVMNHIEKASENFEHPKSYICLLNSYYYILNYKESGTFVDIFSETNIKVLTEKIEKLIQNCFLEYVKQSLKIFYIFCSFTKELEILDKLKKRHSSSYNEASNYQLNTFNEFVEKTAKSHEGIIYYNQKIITSLRDKMIQDVLDPYKDIFTL
ncbi:hypothetical protein MXB_1456 [Myxobolus squamalis]|nr:hypothetical protein MXB_1456 [Myxobolus squamalis]